MRWQRNLYKQKLESSKRQIYIKNVAIGRLTRSWKNMWQSEDQRYLWNFCFYDSCMHAQNNAGKMTSNLLDLQEIPFHRVGHYHNYFIVRFISMITDSEEHVKYFWILSKGTYCIQNRRTVTKSVQNVVYNLSVTSPVITKLAQG